MPNWQDLNNEYTSGNSSIFQGSGFGSNEVARALAAGYTINDVNEFLRQTGIQTNTGGFNQQAGTQNITQMNPSSVTSLMQGLDRGTVNVADFLMNGGLNSRTNGTNSGVNYTYSQYTGSGTPAPTPTPEPAAAPTPAPAQPAQPALAIPEPAAQPTPELPPLDTAPTDFGVQGGAGVGLSGGAGGFRRKESSARKAGLTTKGTSRLKIPLQGGTSKSSGLNIGV
jgi:hypothetical protein